MQLQFQHVDLSVFPALQSWAEARELRGKGMADSLRKILGWWVREALSKIPQGSREKIEADLMRVIKPRKYSALPANRTKKAQRAADLYNKYQGTLAAYIVRKLNYNGAAALRTKNEAAKFYQTVNLYVQRKKFGANIHKAGQIPGLVGTRSAGGYQQFVKPVTRKGLPGSFSEVVAATTTDFLVENFSSAKGGDGISGIAPLAYQNSIHAVVKRIEGYILEDVKKAAQRAGLART